MEKSQLLKIMDRVSVGLTAGILYLVGISHRPPKLDLGMDFSFLPPYHAMCNVIVTLALIMALVFIKRGDVDKHRMSIYVAIFFSFFFLLSYLLYHWTNDVTTFCKEGFIERVYKFVLTSHIILAGLILPFIMFAFNRAYCGFYDKHKKMVKWVYPIWLYVAISGPAVYLMLRSCY